MLKVRIIPILLLKGNSLLALIYSEKLVKSDILANFNSGE